MLKVNSTLQVGETLLTPANNRLFMETAGLNRANLSRYTTNLKSKNCLIKNENNVFVVNPMLVPDITGDIVEYTFTFDIKED